MQDIYIHENSLLYIELYIGYLKDLRKTDGMEACESCQASPWKGPRMERIPRPYPDHSKLPALHYKAVWENPRKLLK